jgi:hypothetical protein
MAVWRASNEKKCAPKNGHYYCRELSHPTSSIVCRGQEGPKGSKDTLTPDFQANTTPRIIVLQKYKLKIFIPEMTSEFRSLSAIARDKDSEAWNS